jgi:N,N-dimethylformamidase
VAPGRCDLDQAVLSEADGACRVVQGHGEEGAFARVDWPDDSVAVRTGTPLRAKQWYRLWVSADPTTDVVVAGQTRLEDAVTAVGVATAQGLMLPGGGAVLIAAEDAGAPRLHFTGKIEDPALFAGFCDSPPAGLRMLARWDFARDIGSVAVTDVGPQACHGSVVNLPCRGMVGAGWSGREVCWRHAPGDYAAIHFHADDLNDCWWDTDFHFVASEELRSGCYMLHLVRRRGGLAAGIRAGAAGGALGADRVPGLDVHLYRLCQPSAGEHRCGVSGAGGGLGAYPWNIDDGRSTYNLLRDGSGLRHFVADTHLLAWLEHKGFALDGVTDEDFDDEGGGLLAVLTGSHPEYHTPRMLDAIEAYTGQGGRLSTWAATDSTGGSLGIRRCHIRSRCGGRRAVFAPGRPNRGSISSSWTGRGAGCGGAAGGRTQKLVHHAGPRLLLDLDERLEFAQVVSDAGKGSGGVAAGRPEEGLHRACSGPRRV